MKLTDGDILEVWCSIKNSIKRIEVESAFVTDVIEQNWDALMDVYLYAMRQVLQSRLDCYCVKQRELVALDLLVDLIYAAVEKETGHKTRVFIHSHNPETWKERYELLRERLRESTERN
jgi:hypothetical protein